jgi:3',5'-cyclic AMP phosphodiesterase CpdA
MKIKYVLLLLAMTLFGCGNVVSLPDYGSKHPWTHTNWNNSSENFQFVVVTDRTGGVRRGVFEQGIEKVNLLQPEFVMSVGDLINGYTHDVKKINKEWDELDRFVAKLNMPFFYLPGNHDYTNKTMSKIWAERYGPSYYHFVYNDTLFLCLNSEEGFTAHRSSFISQKQKDYARKALEDNKDVRWTFVFVHKPIWQREKSIYEENRKNYKKSGWSDIEAMLKGRKHTVFAGHKHKYNIVKRNDKQNYITLATMGGGSSLRGPLFGEFDHFLWVTMTNKGPVMANLMLTGIWDEDFSKEDVKKYLDFYLKNTAVKFGKGIDKNKSYDGQSFYVHLSNRRDIPMQVELDFTKNDKIKYIFEKPKITVAPNSVEIVKVTLKTSKEKREVHRKSLIDSFLKWKVSYDFKQYGKMNFQSSLWLHRFQ